MMRSVNNCTNQNPGSDAFFKTFEMDKDDASIVDSVATSWSRLQTLSFIRELEKYPCLYNLEDPNYKNKRKRFQKYNLLLEKIKKFKSDITFQGIKKKIRTLQKQLFKERKYSKNFGADTDEVYKPKLWCYNELSFLYNSTSPLEPNSSSIEPSETEVTENNHASTSNEPGWNREQTLLLLKELEKYPCLYNPTNNYFANRRKRNEDLNLMLPEVKKFKPDATIDCIKNKIRALQGQLCKEARISKQILTGPDEVYEPKLWCYNELSFMVRCRDSSNLELSEGSETEEDKDDLVMEQTPLIDAGWNALVMEQTPLIDAGWSRPQTLSLIRELQKYPCLYNPADSEFSNIKIRKAKINLMVAEVKKCKPDATFPIVKRKIKTLRCQLWRERKRSQKCRAGPDGQEYKSKWWCYNELLFMNDCYNLQPKPNPSTLTTEQCKKSTDAASTQLNNDSLCTFKIEQQFVEEDRETRSKPIRSYDEFEMENLSNEYCEEENFPKADSEDDNENSGIQYLSKEEDFCQYLCSQFKKIQLDENLEELKLEILQLVSKKIIEEKRAKQQEKYFEISSVRKSEIDPLTQSACSCSTYSTKLPVSKVIENKSNKKIYEIKRNKKWSSTSSSSIYSTTTVPMVSSMDKIGNNLPKRTFMELSDKRFIKEATNKRKKLSSLSSPKLTSTDPLALAMENVLVEEYLDYL